VRTIIHRFNAEGREAIEALVGDGCRLLCLHRDLLGGTCSCFCGPANAALAATDSISSAAIADFIMPDIFII